MDMYVKNRISFSGHTYVGLWLFCRSGETDIEMREKSADDPNAISRNR